MGDPFESGFGFGMGVVDKAFEAKRTNQLAGLAQKAYGAQGQERSSLLGQMAGVSPQGLVQAGQFEEQGDKQAKRLAGSARYMMSAIKSKDPAAIEGAWRTIRSEYEPFARQAGKELPYNFDPAMEPFLHQMIAAAGGDSVQGGNVQSTYIDAQGNRVAIMRDGSTQVLGQNAANNQIIDTGAGFYGVNKGNLQAAPVTVGGAQQPQQQSRAPGEVPYAIDPSLPPEVQASIRQNEGQWASANEGAQVQIPQQGGQLPPSLDYQNGGQLVKAPDPIRMAADQRAADANRRAEEANQRAAEQARLTARGSAPAGMRFRDDDTLEPIPGAPSPSGQQPSEGERGAAGYLQRMNAAEGSVTRLTEEGYRPNLRDAYTAGEGPLRNWAASDTGQVYRQQQEDWVRAKLRKESGAAIPVEEMDREIKTYFPQLGDSEAVIASKAASRITARRQMEILSGRAQGSVGAPAAQPQPGGAVQRAKNPQTGEVLELRNGQWVPAQ